jgi:hypothetical protein
MKPSEVYSQGESNRMRYLDRAKDASALTIPNKEIITRKEAKDLNLTEYFTGNPCKRDHIANRNTLTGTCIECRMIHDQKQYHRNRSKVLARRKIYDKNNPHIGKFNNWKQHGIVFKTEEEKWSWYNKVIDDKYPCDSCGRTRIEATDQGEMLSLDHNHKTGEPRNILCRGCNLIMGVVDSLNSEQIDKLLSFIDTNRN